MFTITTADGNSEHVAHARNKIVFKEKKFRFVPALDLIAEIAPYMPPECPKI